MEYRLLTGTGMTISRLCIGTMMFGGRINEADGVEIIQYAFDKGINFVDTADAYTGGQSEVIVGKAIKPIRDDVILATKVGYPVDDTGDPNKEGLSRRYIMKSIDDSLKRLDTDYIDLYYLHRPIYGHSIEETLDAMNTLVRSGKVRYIGVSNLAAWQICEINWYNELHHGVKPCVTQNVYNMITRGVESELLPFLKEYNTGFVIYNPIAGGLLSGKHKFGQTIANTRFDGSNKMYMDRYWVKENFEAIQELTNIAESNGMSLIDLAIRWCVSQQQVDSILTGMSKLEQLKSNIESAEKGPLSDDILDACDAVWESLAGNRAKYNR